MATFICDRCGQPMESGQLRYVAKIQVYAAYDPLEITFEDMTRDVQGEIRKLLEEMEGKSEAELMDDVHKSFEFDLCAACQKVYIKEPLSGAGPA